MTITSRVGSGRRRCSTRSRLIEEWMQGAGLHTSRDQVLNIIGRWPCTRETPDTPLTSPATRDRPAVLRLGSHLDSVPNAGSYDGVLGVLLAIATVEVLRAEETQLPFDLEVLAFSEEEGTRFATSYLGSRTFCGLLTPDVLAHTDHSGTCLGDLLETLPGRGPAAEPACQECLGYLEAHIEQGPVLEKANAPLGIVTGIVAQSRVELLLTGLAGHAGTVPMSGRRDALVGAARTAVAIRQRALRTPDMVATVGRLDVEPGGSNVIPGTATLTLDLRHPSRAECERAFGEILETARSIAAEEELTLETRHEEHNAEVDCHPSLTKALEETFSAAGLPGLRLASGAGHDAAMMATLGPSAMIFIRCREGISHHPDEHAEPADIAAALDIMCRTVKHLAASHAAGDNDALILAASEENR